MSDSRIADQLVPLGEMTLRVRRVTRRDGVHGKRAPALVFLHDSLGCVETWREFPAALAEHVGLDAIIYDRRGYGQSSPFGSEPRTPRYLEDEADVLFALLDALAIE